MDRFGIGQFSPFERFAMTSLRRIAIAAVLTLIATQLRADVLSTIKQVLASDNLGTQYKIAFVTSGETTATTHDIATYNSFVSAQALSGSAYLSDFVPAGTTWNAIGSTEVVSANANATAPRACRCSTLTAI